MATKKPKNVWIACAKMRDYFPEWTDTTFKVYRKKHKFPVPMYKIGGRLYCKVEEVEQYVKDKNKTKPIN